MSAAHCSHLSLGHVVDGPAGGHGSGEAGFLALDFLPLGKVRNGVEIVGDDGERVAGSNEEAASSEDHVPVAVSVKRHAQHVVALKGSGDRVEKNCVKICLTVFFSF